ncbi:MAG: CubicO group peptidase (beta-lactamase class C family) [Candidatus Poriferisodalaceae bacterium]|jgi:CubicO group peptidase (beta-lactamase class C family)
MNLNDAVGATRALLVVHKARLVAERYGDGIDATTTHASWSMAKSILHTAVGVAGIDPATAIIKDTSFNHAFTLDHLLPKSSGLQWIEEYVPGNPSDVIEMLFGE